MATNSDQYASICSADVAFHFGRLLQVLGWHAETYLGTEMYLQWKQTLRAESLENDRKEARRQLRLQKNERRLLRLQHELHQRQQSGDMRRRSSTTTSDDLERTRRHSVDSATPSVLSRPSTAPPHQTKRHVSSTSKKGASSSPNRKAMPSPSRKAMPGILSRLSRGVTGSHAKDLDNLTEKSSPGFKRSLSVPSNLNRLVGYGEFRIEEESFPAVDEEEGICID